MAPSQHNRDLAAQIAAAVQQRLGHLDPRASQIVSEEVQQVLSRPNLGGTDAPLPSSSQSTSRLVVASNGRNARGIVARLAAVIDEFSGDIRDLSQTIVGDYFTMLFVVDIPDSPDSTIFVQLRHRLKQTADDLGVHVVVMHDDILSTMHSV